MCLFGHDRKFRKKETSCKKCLRIANESDDLGTLGSTENRYSVFCNVVGDAKRTILHAQSSIRCLKEKGIPFILGWSYILLGSGY